MYLSLHADAGFLGCVDSLRSTSGGHVNLQGPNTTFLLSGSSKRQGCVSHFNFGAEIVAAEVAWREKPHKDAMVAWTHVRKVLTNMM